MTSFLSNVLLCKTVKRKWLKLIFFVKYYSDVTNGYLYAQLPINKKGKEKI